jgi:hypothetical protein
MKLRMSLVYIDYFGATGDEVMYCTSREALGNF